MKLQSLRTFSTLTVLLGATALTRCNSDPAPEPASNPVHQGKAQEESKPTKASSPAVEDATLAARKAQMEQIIAKRRDKLPSQAQRTAAGSGDPTGGNFTLAEATAGLEGAGNKLMATIETSLGSLKCELWPDKAPITVANFVGLARGTRPWRSDGQWVKKPLYDGTTFHRIIKGFMIQGGDPNGNGSGGPGYEIPDEIWSGAHHDTRGQLCMANRGPNTNGSQFFIMDGAAKHLDGGYTIFGQCSPDAVIEKIAATPPRGDKPVSAPLIKKVSISKE